MIWHPTKYLIKSLNHKFKSRHVSTPHPKNGIWTHGQASPDPHTLKSPKFTAVTASLPSNTAKIFLILSSSNPICVSTVPPAL